VITRRTREQVLDLTERGSDPFTIALHLELSVAEVDRILDEADDRAIPHDRPRIEPPAEPAKRGERATRKAPAVRRQPGPARSTIAYRAELQPCGTPAAYVRHERHGETPCDECKAARAEVRLKRARAKGVKPRAARAEHGTPARYQGHYRDGETPCDPCKTAYNEWKTAAKRAARAAQQSKGDTE
jgi:hypothetical protein